MEPFGWLFSIIGTIIIVTFVLMLMDRLDFGISLDNFWTALISAFSIAVFLWMLNLVAFGVSLFQPDFGTGALSLLAAWVIVAAVLYFVAWMRQGFEIKNFLTAMIGVLVMGLMIVGINAIIGLFI